MKGERFGARGVFAITTFQSNARVTQHFFAVRKACLLARACVRRKGRQGRLTRILACGATARLTGLHAQRWQLCVCVCGDELLHSNGAERHMERCPESTSGSR